MACTTRSHVSRCAHRRRSVYPGDCLDHFVTHRWLSASCCQLRDRLKTEYEYEQRKKLRDLIGCYHGGILQAVEEFNYRMMSLYASEDEDWLNVGDDYQGVGSDPNNYYFQTTVHRFLALFVLIRRFESEALYADSRIADKKDFEFLKYSRAILWAATGTHLFSGLAYDVSESKDHFFRDGKTTSSGMT